MNRSRLDISISFHANEYLVLGHNLRADRGSRFGKHQISYNERQVSKFVNDYFLFFFASRRLSSDSRKEVNSRGVIELR